MRKGWGWRMRKSKEMDSRMRRSIERQRREGSSRSCEELDRVAAGRGKWGGGAYGTVGVYSFCGAGSELNGVADG